MTGYKGLKLLFGAMTLLGLAACSDATDELKGVEDSGTAYRVYKLDIMAGNEAENTTRSLSLDDKNVVLSKWASGDQMFVYSCSDDETNSTRETYSTVATTNNGSHAAKFTGDIYSQNAITINDKLAFFYPGAALADAKNVKACLPVVETVDMFEYDEEGNPIKKVGTIDITTYEPSVTIKDQVRLNLSEQDGTLANINERYDYNWGVVNPTAVKADGTISANVNLKRLVSFWGLKFTDESNTAITNIRKIFINGVKSTAVLKLEDGTYIEGEQDKDFTIEVGKGMQPIIGDNGYIWIALFPEASEKINITLITTDGSIYTKDVHKAFAVNKTYRSTITRMTPPKAEPYVEVNKVKWATGNFIHYTDGNEDYWGIAPAQWWISNYADNPTRADWVDLAAQNVEVKSEQPGSQHWFINNHETGFGMTEEDCDLFDHGVIAEAFSFKGKKYMPWNPNIKPDTREPFEGKWFDSNRKFTTDRTKAYYGDIAHFYTTDVGRNHPYRYPKMEEFKALMQANTVIPAYCYSDKGNKIYGGYFSDGTTGGVVGSKAFVSFPTGRGKLWKFEDVTGLVLANKGLFLPITGFMYGVLNQNRVNYRLVDYGNKFSAHYWSSQSSAVSTATGLAFGSNEWIYGAAQKTQATAIRPVYIGTEEQAELPVDASKYNMFHNIVTAEGNRRY
jgi:hypothetical protein